MDDLKTELRTVLRAWRHRPGSHLAIVLSLALGIAAVTVLFSIGNALYLRPLPFEEPDRLVRLRDVRYQPEGDPTMAGTTEASYRALRGARGAFAGVATQQEGSFTLVGSEEPQRVRGAYVTSDLLPLLGVEPVLGRTFSAQEGSAGGANDVALLGHGLWRRQFAGDPGVLGRVVRVNGMPRTVIGVLPRHFEFPYSAELWLPLVLTQDAAREGDHNLFTIARLAPRVGLERAQAEADAVAERLARDYPQSHDGWDILVRPLRAELIQDVQSPILATLFGAAAFLLLIASANVAALLLARGVEQERDLSLHVALGAPRRRLIRRLVLQGVVLALVAGAVGLGLALLALPPVVAVSPLADLDGFFRDTSIDWRVFGFVAALSVVVGVLFSLPPALQASRPDVQALLKAGGRSSLGRGRRRLLDLFVVGEIAVAVLLLVTAGLLVRNLTGLLTTDPGFSDDGVLVAHLALPPDKYPEEADRIAFLERVRERLENLPGAEAVGIANLHPLDDIRLGTVASFEGHPPADPADATIANHRVVSTGFLEAMGVPILRGRALTAEDRAGGRPVAVVSKRLADLHWANEDPVGRRVKRGGYDADRPWMTVVGVAGDVADSGDFEYTWYVPYLQNDLFNEDVAVAVRTRGEPLALANAVRREIWELDTEQPIFDVTTNGAMIARTFGEERFAVVVAAILAGVGLAMALLGIHGLLAYSVLQRRMEIGVRLAFGARRTDVVSRVVARGVVLAAVGLAIGLIASLGAARLVARFLPEVDANQPLVFAVITLTILLAAAAASFLPALRAARLDPVSALRPGT
jgi:predicted permease